MIKVKQFTSGVLSNNTYLVYNDSCENKNAIIIDPTGCFYKVSDFIEKNNIKIDAILLTHGHFDHVLDVPLWQKKGIDMYVNDKEKNNLLCKRTINMLNALNLPCVNMDKSLIEKNYNFGEIAVKAINTPGHTEGSFCFIIENYLFSGDTLFARSYGRTDFIDGDFEKMKKSLRRLLFDLDADLKILPGHEESSTIYYEREHNPILMYL